jgi:glyoxylate/hydroxypyruvate reductase A
MPGQRLLLARGEVADAAIDAAIVANPPPGGLVGLPGLRLIQSLWAGVDRLLADASLPTGVPIARMVDPAMSAAMAETALWATLSLHRGFFGYARQQQAACWLPRPQQRADALPVLVLGHGQMGRTVASRLAQQGYPVSAWRRGGAAPTATAGPKAHASVRLLVGDPALHTALAQARIVINLLPLTPDTRGLIDAGLLARLPRGAGLVNLARGAHLVDADLLAALASGQVGHAVLDVFHTEPLPADHAYWRHPQVTVLPHAAAMTDPRSAAAVVARNIAALAEGAPLHNLVVRDAGY